MTIFDFLKLLKRNLRLLVALPLVCAVAAVVWCLFAPTNYVASASFVSSGDLALAQGFATKEAASYSNSSVRISCSSNSTSKIVTITAVGSNSATCVEAVNSVANGAVRQYKEANNGVIATINEASDAAKDSPSKIKTAFFAFVAGLFLAVFIIVIKDMLRLSIKSEEDVERSCALPVLGVVPSAEGAERLLANLQFRCDGRPSSIAIVPVGIATTAPVVARELAGVLERSDVRVKLVKGSPFAKKFQVSVPEDAAIVVSCEPLAVGMGAAYIAHNADVTVLCVRAWTDSKQQLSATIKELELAKANIAGIAYLPEGEKLKGNKEPHTSKSKE